MPHATPEEIADSLKTQIKEVEARAKQMRREAQDLANIAKKLRKGIRQEKWWDVRLLDGNEVALLARFTFSCNLLTAFYAAISRIRNGGENSAATAEEGGDS